jgi:hypothetical protein
MPQNDPTNYGWLTYAWIFLLSAWGGSINYRQKVKQGLINRFSVVEFIGDLSTSFFSGVVTFFFCEAANFDPILTAGFVGIAGHMGSRLIFVFEQFLQTKIEQFLQSRIKNAPIKVEEKE